MITKHAGRPFWVNWLQWHLLERHLPHKRRQRHAGWDFINRIRAIPAGSVVIDCGANVGEFTSIFLRRGFLVHAFEPDPDAREALRNRLGSDPRVTIYPYAVGVRAETVTLFRKPDLIRHPNSTKSSSLLKRDVHADMHSVPVEVIDFSGFIRQLGSPVALIKMDIEGAEAEVLMKMIDDGTYGRAAMIYAETHERHSVALAAATGSLRRRIAEAHITNINLDWH